jgi:hypothetical protein
MLYSDGLEAALGDKVAIGNIYSGLVVACLDRSQYSLAYPEDQWSYLKSGILVETDFAGLVYYPSPLEGDYIELVARAEISAMRSTPICTIFRT